MGARCSRTIESRKRARTAAGQQFDAPAVRNQIAAIAGQGFRDPGLDHRERAALPALQLEKFTYFMVCCLIVLVAAFNIIATL